MPGKDILTIDMFPPCVNSPLTSDYLFNRKFRRYRSTASLLVSCLLLLDQMNLFGKSRETHPPYEI